MEESKALVERIEETTTSREPVVLELLLNQYLFYFIGAVALVAA